MTSGGDLIFGSTAGAVRLSPDRISVAEFTAPLRITGFTIDGIGEKESEQIKPKIFDMLQKQKIVLSAGQKDMTLTGAKLLWQAQSASETYRRAAILLK